MHIFYIRQHLVISRFSLYWLYDYYLHINRHIHTLSYHHFNTMEISNVHKFRTNVVPITDARDYGCCHQSNLLAWSSSGCMTLRRSRRQGKSRISENEAAAEPAVASASTKPPISNKILCRSSLVLYSCTQELSSFSTKPFLLRHRKRWLNINATIRMLYVIL